MALASAELKSAVKLKPVCGRRDTHRSFFYQVGSLLASIIAIREILKNPTTSVTVVKMIEEVHLGRRRHRSALGTQILLSCVEQRVVVPPQFDLPHVGINAHEND